MSWWSCSPSSDTWDCARRACHESAQEIERSEREGTPPIGIGSGSVIENAIVDKNARVGRGVRILNEKEERERDAAAYYIRDGIVVIPKNAVIPDGTVI